MPPKKKAPKKKPPVELKGPLTADERDKAIAHLKRDWNSSGADLESATNFPGRSVASLSAHLRSLRKELKTKEKTGYFSFITPSWGLA
jgi:hypothetical protein